MSDILTRHSAAPGAANRTPTAPNDRRRLHGSIAHDIAVAIVGGKYQPGDVLPNEDDFSQQLEVSRTAYREAVRILAAKGLVESRPKTGTRICDRSRWNFIDPDVLAWHFEVEPSDDFVRALFELRQIVEPAAAALAAERRTERDLEVIGAALSVMRAETLATDVGCQADLEFHHAILVAAHNEPLAALSSGIGATVRWTTNYKRKEARRMRDPIKEHEDVFEAIVRRDAATAREQMNRLVEYALDDTRQIMKNRR